MTRDTTNLIAVLQLLGAEVVESNDIGDYAIELAVRGWLVFPLRGKVPAIPNPHAQGSVERTKCKGNCGLGGHGVLDATSDLEQIEAWWSGPYRDHNIGARVPKNAFVLDVDPRNGGLESLDRLLGAYGQLPRTLTCISGRGDGGCHRYFKRPVGKLTDRHLGNGVDIKTSAGYCVVPPSIHPDGRRPYTWVEAPVADPPEWLIDLVRPPASPPGSTENFERIARNNPAGFGDLVADQFGQATTWAHILGPHRWRCLDPDGGLDGDRWLHPAATSACSATIRHGCLFVYSPNTPFEVTTVSSPHGYTKFRAHAVLNFGGDMSAAARAVRTTGAF